jgi:hypothetical protein
MDHQSIGQGEGLAQQRTLFTFDRAFDDGAFSGFERDFRPTFEL